jgi:hypothetical protein
MKKFMEEDEGNHLSYNQYKYFTRKHSEHGLNCHCFFIYTDSVSNSNLLSPSKDLNLLINCYSEDISETKL